MAQEIRAKKYSCARCGKAFSSPTRLEHHHAAEHAIRSSRDIQTRSDIRTMSALRTMSKSVRAKKGCL